MYSWNQFRNFPKFKNMSPQEQSRQYFIYQSNMMYEASINTVAAAAAAAAGSGGGGGLRNSEFPLSKRAIRKEYVFREFDFMDDTRYAPTLQQINTEPNFSGGSHDAEDYATTYRALRDTYWQIENEKYIWESKTKTSYFPRQVNMYGVGRTFTKMPEYPVSNVYDISYDSDGYVMLIYPNDNGSLFNIGPLEKLNVAWYLPINEIYEGNGEPYLRENGWGAEGTDFETYEELLAAYEEAQRQRQNYYNFVDKQLGRSTGFTYYPVGYPTNPSIEINASIPYSINELTIEELEYKAIAKTYVVDRYTNTAWHLPYWKYQYPPTDPNAVDLMPGVTDITWLTQVDSVENLPTSGKFGDVVRVENDVDYAWNGTEFSSSFFDTYIVDANNVRDSIRYTIISGNGAITGIALALKPFVWSGNYLPIYKVSNL